MSAALDNSYRAQFFRNLGATEDNLLSRRWVQIIVIYLSVQALVGIIAIEYAFARTKRFREANEGRDSQYPHFRRYDAKHWKRWKFYPGAMFLMPTRLMLLSIDGLFLTTFVS